MLAEDAVLDEPVRIDLVKDLVGQVWYSGGKDNKFVVLAHDTQEDVEAAPQFRVGLSLAAFVLELPLMIGGTSICRSHFSSD